LSGRAITSLKYILNEGSLQRKLRPSNLTTMFLYSNSSRLRSNGQC